MQMVETVHLEKQHGSQFRLGPLDITVRAGELVGVVGGCGEGKTTLLQLVWGFLRPDRGCVRVFRQEPHLNQLAVRTRTGYLRASPSFNEGMTVRRHLQFVGEFYTGWSETSASALLRRFAMNPDALVYQLPPAVRRKLALISAIAHEPELLLLDEPLAGWSLADHAEIAAFLRTEARERGCGIIMTACHSCDVSGVADTVIRL